MAFERLKNLLKERSDERPAIHEAFVLQKLNNIWAEHGILIFPKAVQEHLKMHVRVVGFRKKIVTFAADDVHSASAVSLELEQVRKLFEEHLPKITIQRIMIHQTTYR